MFLRCLCVHVCRAVGPADSSEDSSVEAADSGVTSHWGRQEHCEATWPSTGHREKEGSGTGCKCIHCLYVVCLVLLTSCLNTSLYESHQWYMLILIYFKIKTMYWHSNVAAFGINMLPSFALSLSSALWYIFVKFLANYVTCGIFSRSHRQVKIY